MIGNVCPVSGEDHQWIQASDDIVHSHLTETLERAIAATGPMEILGIDDSSDPRQAFLAITKVYHPSRFARRPANIRKLANDVYICLKEAYEGSAVDVASRNLERARTDPGGGAPRVARGSDTGTPTEDNDARMELKERRRERLKNRLQSGANPTASSADSARRAQIRAATTPDDTASESELEEREERDFEKAVEQMNGGLFSEASVSFKRLAVARPSEKRYRMHMHYSQGQFHQAAGREKDARSEYKRALGIDASFSLAHTAMATLPDEHSKKKPGIFSRIFRK